MTNEDLLIELCHDLINRAMQYEAHCKDADIPLRETWDRPKEKAIRKMMAENTRLRAALIEALKLCGVEGEGALRYRLEKVGHIVANLGLEKEYHGQ